MASGRLEEALRDFITGRGVERAKLELIHGGRPVIEEFIVELRQLSFHASTVAAISVEPGERVPAFYIKDSTAFFGWVFWEKFTEKKLRKLWGSVVRNSKGDWLIQIPPNKATTIYANIRLKTEMDIDHPV
ncbi:MAG: hypothetical protein HY562_12055 [Ignavibacteriales bacterium]|nr:hypothetical protein [Ignavibacteriales bacterium]